MDSALLAAYSASARETEFCPKANDILKLRTVNSLAGDDNSLAGDNNSSSLALGGRGCGPHHLAGQIDSERIRVDRALDAHHVHQRTPVRLSACTRN